MNKVEKAIAAGLTIGACLSPMAKADEVSGDIGYIQSEDPKNSYTEACMGYGLPGDVKGFTFMDFNTDPEKGYYGKSTLIRRVVDDLCARAQVVHGDEPFTKAGLGVEANVPMPKNTSAKIRFMPLWVDDEGIMNDYMEVEACLGANLGKGFSVGASGRINANDGSWCTGGLTAYKDFGRFKVGYDGVLNKGDGKLDPVLEHRFAVRMCFGGKK